MRPHFFLPYRPSFHHIVWVPPLSFHLPYCVCRTLNEWQSYRTVLNTGVIFTQLLSVSSEVTAKTRVRAPPTQSSSLAGLVPRLPRFDIEILNSVILHV